MSLALADNFAWGTTMRPCGTPPRVERPRRVTAGPFKSITVLSTGATPGGRLSRERIAPEKPDMAVSPGAKAMATSARLGTAQIAASAATSAKAIQLKIQGRDFGKSHSLRREAPQLD